MEASRYYVVNMRVMFGEVREGFGSSTDFRVEISHFTRCWQSLVKIQRWNVLEFWRDLNKLLKNAKMNNSVYVDLRLDVPGDMLAGWTRLELPRFIFWPLSEEGIALVQKWHALRSGYAHADVLGCLSNRMTTCLTVRKPNVFSIVLSLLSVAHSSLA